MDAMNKYEIAVLGDYQNVALESADWSVLHDRVDIAVFQNQLASGLRQLVRTGVREQAAGS
jgi:hypothetical protein